MNALHAHLDIYIVKISIKKLREIIREEYLRGVPNFELRQITNGFVGSLKSRIKNNIQQTSHSNEQAKERYEALNDVFKELEEEVNDLVDDKIWSFISRT